MTPPIAVRPSVPPARILFWFVAPPDAVRPAEVPAGCGLLEVSAIGDPAAPITQRVVVEAPYRETVPPTWNFLAAVARHAQAAAMVLGLTK